MATFLEREGEGEEEGEGSRMGLGAGGRFLLTKRPPSFPRQQLYAKSQWFEFRHPKYNGITSDTQIINSDT